MQLNSRILIQIHNYGKFLQLKGLQHSGVILELKVHCEKYKSSSDTLNKMMSARKKGINNEYRISLTKRPRPNKCPSPNKCVIMPKNRRHNTDSLL